MRAAPLPIAVLVALAAGAAPALGAPSPVTAVELAPPSSVPVAPGVTLTRADRGDLRAHILRVKPGPRRTIEPVMTGGSPVRRATLTTALRARLPLGGVAGINGDFFSFDAGDPSGLFLSRGDLVSAPEPSRSALLLPPAAPITTGRLRLTATWQAADPEAPVYAIDGLNRLGDSGRETVLFTPAYGTATPTGNSRFEVRVRLDAAGALAPNVPIAGTVVLRRSGGGTPIGAGHLALSGVGADGPELSGGLPLGARLTITPTITGLPPEMREGIGGGPLLVAGGRPVTDAGEGFSSVQLYSRTSRAAVGQRADGGLMLVAVEGPREGRAGVTVAEQAQLMADLGAVTAIAMDGGGSASLAVGDRSIVPTSGQREITNAITVNYAGVNIPPLAPRRISPNRDRVDERLVTSVRVPVRGTLTVTVNRRGRKSIRITRRIAGPTTRRIVIDARRLRLGDGPYRLAARLEPLQGGGATTHSRDLIVDRTLAALTTRARVQGPPRARKPRLDVRFRLFRRARVSLRVEDGAGRTLRTLMRSRTLGAGNRSVTWDRTISRRPARGSYRIVVEARSPLGRTGLATTVTLSDPRGG